MENSNNGREIVDFMNFRIAHMSHEEALQELFDSILEHINAKGKEEYQKSHDNLMMSCYVYLKNSEMQRMGGGMDAFLKNKQMEDDMIQRIRFFDTEKN